MSLASHSALLVTGIRMAEGRDDLLGLDRVRWECPQDEPEESSIGDLIYWIEHHKVRAYVRQPNGSRGPRLEVVDGPTRRYLRSRPAGDGHDILLSLPRF
jgi:hypothetical protein